MGDEGFRSSCLRRVDDKFDSAAGRKGKMGLWVCEVGWSAAVIQRDAVNRDQPKRLRDAIAQNGKVQIGDRRGVQYPPELAFARLHDKGGGLVIGVGNRNKIDGEIFRGLAKASSCVHSIAIVIDQEFR